MNRIPLKLDEITTRVLALGLEGEKDHVQFAFDASSILSEYPDATVALSVKPPVGDIYPVAVSKDGTNVLWTVSAADCAHDGDGQYQLTFTHGEEIEKTFKGFFKVYESIVGNGTAPTPVQEWLAAAQEALNALEDVTASAHDLAHGESATAQIETVGNHKNINIGVPAGAPGQDGHDGEDGFSPVITVTDITGGHRLSIETKTGTQTVDVMDGTDGKDGKDGTDGQDGFSPTITVTNITGGHRITITDATGTKTVDVMDGNPATIIDDTAPALDKTYSSSKIAQENQNLLSAIHVLEPTATSGDVGKVPKVKTVTDGKVSEYEFGSLPSVPVTDVQVNGTTILNNRVANIPYASANVAGLAKPGITMYAGDGGVLGVNTANATRIKAGTAQSFFITPSVQDQSVFYGLAKASGDTTQASSSNSVGIYTESALSAISQMFNAPVSVSGSTPSITAKAGVRYICGEVSTLTIVVPASGIIDVTFDSGSTATVLTVTPPTGVTIKWANGFDPTSLDANTTYEINIMDGCYGVVGKWT